MKRLRRELAADPRCLGIAFRHHSCKSAREHADTLAATHDRNLDKAVSAMSLIAVSRSDLEVQGHYEDGLEEPPPTDAHTSL